MAKNRSIKVVSRNDYNYRVTPTIKLKGQWLKELGFDIGDYVFPSAVRMENRSMFCGHQVHSS